MAGVYTVSLGHIQGLSTEQLLATVPDDGRTYILRYVILANNLSVVQNLTLQLRPLVGAPVNVLVADLPIGATFHQDLRVRLEHGDQLWCASTGNLWEVLLTAYALTNTA